jgi:hypothetical protein
VMSGVLDGALDVAGTTIALKGTGYHDHNWGFWQGVTWQWGQVQQGDLSVLYGRVFPPAEAADRDRLPGFVGVLGPDGPLAYATRVQITETDDQGKQPQRIAIDARGPSLDVRLQFDVASHVTTPMTQGALSSGMDFLQLRGQYTVKGRAGA